MAAAALLAVLLLWHEPAAAQSTTAVPGTTITVNSKGDGTQTGNCTLREAITAANTNAQVDGCAAGSATQRDEILFSLGQEATIVLGSQLPTITDAKGLNINGVRAKITVSGNDTVRVFEVGSGAKLTLANLTVADGVATAGGGLFNNSGTVNVFNSTFSGNTASDDFGGDGGGIFNTFGTLRVTNSTFSGNSATESATFASFGGGIQSGGIGSTLTVTNSTFSENSATDGGGISTGAATLRNTIMANNTAAAGGSENCAGTITDGGYNIDDGTTCGFSTTNNSQPSTDPLLDPNGLQDNGGPTKTIKLQALSPARNAIPEGTNGCGTEVTTDQRGVIRPQGEGCEIGSFEDTPRVTRVVPQEDATGVAPAPNILAYFSEQMSETSINESTFKLFKVGTTTAIGAQVEYIAERKKAILNPNDPLQLGVRYRAIVTTEARSVSGDRLDQDQDPSNGNQPKVWFFTVRSN
jgi:CSLREA domain-containing protein